MTGADVAALAIVAGWLRTLAAVTRHPGGGPDNDTLAAYATLLARDFPLAALTADSLHHVVQGVEWWPAYDLIRRRLAEWWQQQAPPPPPLAGMGDDLAPMDRLWLRYAERRQAEGADPGRVLALVRSQSPAAYGLLAGRDGGAWIAAG